MAFNFIPRETVEVPEIGVEDKLSLSADKTAVIVVDMQNDFVKPGGSLLVDAAKETVVNIRNLLSKARKAGAHIAYTQDTHFAGDREWEIWPEHCKRETWGWEIIEELQPLEHDLVCEKNRYDGFYGTWLEHYLSRIWKVEHVVIMGTVSNICVLHTAGSAGLRWFEVVVPADGISALTEFDQAATLRQITTLYAGKVVASAEAVSFI